MTLFTESAEEKADHFAYSPVNIQEDQNKSQQKFLCGYNFLRPVF